MSNWALSQAGRYILATDDTSVVSSATAHTKGSWVQLSAAAPENVHGISLTRWQSNSGARVLLDISIGASGSESSNILLENLVMVHSDEYRNTNAVSYIPIAIPAGARVSARISSNVSAAVTNKLRFAFMQANGLTPVGAGQCVTYGANVATTEGTYVAVGAGGGYGAQTEFVASLPLPARGVALAMCFAGAFGSNYGWAIRARVMVNDQNLGPLWNWLQFDGNAANVAHLPTFYPCHIPAGAKVGITATNNDGYAPTRPFILYLLH